MKRLAPLLVAAVGLLLMVAIIATGPEIESEDAPPPPPTVEVVEARPETVRMSVTAHGVAAPKTASRLVAEVSGRIVSVADSMVAGGFFSQGDVLVAVDRLDYEVALEQARARLASAESELASAGRAFERQEELAAAHSGSESMKDEAHNRQRVAEASLREAKALLARAERDLERTEIVAPYDGRVRTEQVDPGQFVSRGEALASVYSVDFAEVRLPVPDEDLAFLPVALDGAPPGEALPEVVLRARFAGREHAWQGRIVRTEGEIDAETRTVAMVAQVPKPYERRNDAPPLTVGLFVEAEIMGREVHDVARLPRTALQDDDRVLLVGEDGRLAVREVEFLRLVGDVAYVRGLRAGEKVCVTRLPGVAEGSLVRPRNAHDARD